MTDPNELKTDGGVPSPAAPCSTAACADCGKIFEPIPHDLPEAIKRELESCKLCSECAAKRMNVVEPIMESKTLEPYQWGRIRSALQSGIEHANECLSRHEIELGRTTRKNRLWAEQIERDIEEMQYSLNLLSSNSELSGR